MLSFETAGIERSSATTARFSITAPFLSSHFSPALTGKILYIYRLLLLVPAGMDFFLIISRVLRSQLADGISNVRRSK
jgi:hypothetical protein